MLGNTVILIMMAMVSFQQVHSLKCYVCPGSFGKCPVDFVGVPTECPVGQLCYKNHFWTMSYSRIYRSCKKPELKGLPLRCLTMDESMVHSNVSNFFYF